jgi:chromate reductase
MENVMEATGKTIRLLGLAGSLRKDSYSLAVLRGLESELGDNIKFKIGDLRLPLYNQDEDGPASPPAVRFFRSAIAEGDAVVIVTPEFNHGIPGVLKNALDWASRPFGKSVLIGKPVLTISISPAFTGGARAHSQVNETLLSIPAKVIGGPQVVIGGVSEKVKDGRLIDRASLDFSLSALRRVIAPMMEAGPQHAIAPTLSTAALAPGNLPQA